MGRVRKVAFREQAGGGVAGNLQRERGQDGNGCLAQSKVSSGKYEDGRTSYWGGGLQLANRQADVYGGKSILEPIFCC